MFANFGWFGAVPIWRPRQCQIVCRSLGKLHQDLGATMIYVTHDPIEPMTLADKIVVLRDSVVQQIGAPLNHYHRPVKLFVAGFIGSPKMNFLPVEVLEREGGEAKIAASGLDPIVVPAASAWAGGAKGMLGVRPQYFSLAPSPAAGELHGVV